MEEQSVAAGTYLPLAGGTMAGDLNMDDYQINGVDDIKSNDSNGIAIRTSSGAIAMYFSWFGYAFVAHNDSSMGGFTLKTMADPTAAQDAATKNYADTRLLSKEVVTDWTDGYIPVYNATSGKFEMENVALPIFEESSNVIRERTGYDNDFVVGSPQLADDGNTAHDARMWFDKGSAAFRAGGVSGAEWDAGNVGNYSHAEGIDTTASGIASHAEGGDSVASGNRSHAEGNYTTASGENSHAEGNYSNASGSRSHAEGRYAEAIGDYSHAEGFYAKAYLDTQHAKAAGQFAAKGDAQISNVVARIETTDATAAVEMFIDGSSKQAVLPENRTWAFIINIAARQTAGAGTVGDSGIYKIEGGIKRDGAGNTALVGAITKTTLAEDQAAWDVTAEADNTNEALVVKVTGEASKTIHWVAAINLVEVG
ncbi:MAG: hypothetical protein U9R21_03730 [Candidatus Thermoplasmatota archaeon]|nr:hypothetical protein [Candidatus Thermoplasmatota archaeon]